MIRYLAGAVLGTLATACVAAPDIALRPAPADARSGGRIVVGITAPGAIDPAALDPFDAAGSLVVRTMCDPLVALDARTARLVPAVARSWQVLDGGRRIVVRLRKGVRFPDGREVHADDAVAAFQRLADPRAAAPGAELLRPVAGYEEATGERDASGAPRDRLRGVRVVDAFTFEISLARPLADFVAVLASPALVPVPRRAVERNRQGFGKQPVCAGPYRLAGAPTGAEIRLVRADGYQPVNAAYTAGGRGYADEIVFRVFPERAAAYAAARSGNTDVARVPRSELPSARTLPGTVIAPTGAVEFIGLPTTVGPFADRDVRVALSLAVDRRRLVEEAWAGAHRPASAFLPPTLDAHRRDACGATAPPAGNARLARELLNGSGEQLESLTLYVNDELGNRAAAEGLARQWRETLGIGVEVSGMPWDRYEATGREQPGFQGPFRLGWGPAWPGADAALAPAFASASVGRDNWTRFSDDDADRMLERDARRATDVTDRRDAYRRIEDLLCEAMPAIPLAFATAATYVVVDRLGSALPGWAERATGEVAPRELYVKESPGRTANP